MYVERAYLRKELLAMMKRRGVEGRWLKVVFDAQDIEWLIEEAPETDAVEVVRCKDCKEYICFGDDWFCGRIGSYFGNTKPNDFCSRGVRKSDAHD